MVGQIVDFRHLDLAIGIRMHMDNFPKMKTKNQQMGHGLGHVTVINSGMLRNISTKRVML